MKLLQLPVKDAYIVEFDRHCDDRGYLEEVYNDEQYPEELRKYFPVKQNTVSQSHKVRVQLL